LQTKQSTLSELNLARHDLAAKRNKLWTFDLSFVCLNVNCWVHLKLCVSKSNTSYLYPPTWPHLRGDVGLEEGEY